MGKSKPKQQVVEYRMSIHFGICAGPIDYISRIVIGEKEAWKGKIADFKAFTINKTNLFGGIKKEGGVAGQVTYLPGKGDQILPELLAGKYGKTSATMPAYRGISSLFFTEVPSSDPESILFAGYPIFSFFSFLFGLATGGRKGFYWSANSPYLRGVWVEAARASIGLNPSYARIYRQVSEDFTPQVNQQITSPSGTSQVDYAVDIKNGYVVNAGTNVLQCWKFPNMTTPLWRRTDVGSPQAVSIDDLGNVVVGYQSSDHVRVFNITSGVEKANFTGMGSGVTNTGITTRTVGGVTYIFELSGDLYMGSGSGSSFSHVDTVDTAYGWLTGTLSFCASNSNLYFPNNGFLVLDGTRKVQIVPWSSGGFGVPSAEIDLTADLFGDIVSISWIDDLNAVLIIDDDSGLHLYNADLSTRLLFAHGINEAKWGVSTPSHLMSNRIYRGSGVIAFRASGVDVSGNVIVQYNVEDLSLISITDASVEPYFNHANGGYAYSGVDPSNDLMLVLGADGISPLVGWSLPPIVDSVFDSNPAHIIFELLPYTKLGTSTAGTDKTAFEAAALTLYNERFGLSLQWTRQSTIEDFVREIQDHIEAAIFLNPKTGLLTIKLIRGDYDPDTLPVFTPDNCTVTNFSRKLWGETINQIVVSWTNPENEEEESVTVQDLANIAVQDGQIISDDRNYYGIRRRDLAAFVAQRDLRVASAPLASCDLECDRTAWDLLPGDVIKLVSPEDGITSIFMRVGPVDYGKPGDSKVKVNLVEDIFALPLAEYSVPPPPQDNDNSEDPAPAAFTYIFTLPYYMVTNEVDATASAGVEYPVVFAGVLAAQTGSDTHQFDLIGETTDAVGNVISEDLGTRSIASRATLPVDIVEEIETLIDAFPDRTTGEGPAVGGLVVIGNGDETQVELGLVVGADETGFTIRRGVLDTVPHVWPAGTPVWFVNDGLSFVDNEQRSDGETVDYKVLPQTSQGTLEEADATWLSAVLTGRPWLPLRPANVTVNGFGIGSGIVDVEGVNPIPIAVATRNRLTEDALVLAWDAATVTPETDQTWRLVLMMSDRTPITTISGLTGTTYDLAPGAFAGATAGIIRVESERDGLISLQGTEIRVLLANGYGYAYGYNYGGA